MAIQYRLRQNTSLPHSGVYFLTDRETKVPKSIQVLQVEKLGNWCIKISEEMDFYHKYVAPLLLYFFFWDDVVERGYFLYQIFVSNKS